MTEHDQRKVYPRVCGGTSHSTGPTCRFSGLSPRVRGNLEYLFIFVVIERSIPACAGEPRSLCRDRSALWVYPRVCGGTESEWNDVYGAEGLSPRVRGNLDEFLSFLRKERSIPACAGEPSQTRSECNRTGVYPRVCGGTPKMNEFQNS